MKRLSKKFKSARPTPKNNLRGGDELGGGGEAIGHKRVSQVIGEVLKRSLSGDDCLHEESEHGEHGESAILDLLHLELSESIGVVSKAQGVEGLTRVEGIETLASGATVHTVSLNQAHEHNLGEQGGGDGLGVDESGVAQVVEATVSEDGGTSLEPDGGITKLNAVLGEELGGHATKSTEHGPASVDDLDLAITGKGLGVSGETGGVPSVISGVFALEVGDLRGEGAQEFSTVRSVEFGACSDGALQKSKSK